MMHAKSRALWQTAVYRSIDGTCVANQIARYAIVGHWGMLTLVQQPRRQGKQNQRFVPIFCLRMRPSANAFMLVWLFLWTLEVVHTCLGLKNSCRFVIQLLTTKLNHDLLTVALVFVTWCLLLVFALTVLIGPSCCLRRSWLAIDRAVFNWTSKAILQLLWFCSARLGGTFTPRTNRPFSLGGHVESQENKKLCLCTASLALNSRVGEANRAKTNLFNILLRLNMAAEWGKSIQRKTKTGTCSHAFSRAWRHLHVLAFTYFWLVHCVVNICCD